MIIVSNILQAKEGFNLLMSVFLFLFFVLQAERSLKGFLFQLVFERHIKITSWGDSGSLICVLVYNINGPFPYVEF